MNSRLAALLLFFASVLPGLSSEDFSTVNGDKLERFSEAFAERQGPVRVLCFGDSMSDSYQSISLYLVNQMLERRPFAGTSFNNSYNRTLWKSTNGVTVAPPSNLWLSYQFKVPQGSSVWWDNWHTTNGILADRLGLYWVAQPEGGDFKLLASKRGGEWREIAVLDGYGDALAGRSTNLSVALSEYRLMVQSVTGTNYIIGPELVNSQTNGLHVAWLSYGGISVQQVADVSRDVRDPILRGFSPDLLIWHFKEGATALANLSIAMAENESWFVEAAPGMEVLYIGTPYSQDANGGADTMAENSTVRAFAVQNGRTFVDCMTPGVSFEWLRDGGFMLDAVHHNAAGGEYLGKAAWKDLRWFALGADRRTSLERQGTKLVLSAILRQGIAYDFQWSADVADWTTFESRTNQSGEVRIELPHGEPVRHFRMRLQPIE